MPRRLLNALTVVSAVVCVVSLGLVAGSWRWVNAVTVPIDGGRGAVGAYSIDGGLRLWKTRLSPILVQFGTRYQLAHRNSSAAQLRPRANLDPHVPWLNIGWHIMSGYQVVILPLWLLPLLTAIAPVRWWRRRRREAGRGFPVAAATVRDAY
jgi:hypothetical protein